MSRSKAKKSKTISPRPIDYVWRVSKHTAAHNDTMSLQSPRPEVTMDFPLAENKGREKERERESHEIEKKGLRIIGSIFANVNRTEFIVGIFFKLLVLQPNNIMAQWLTQRGVTSQ